jgi:hypothetical protein
MQWNKYAGNVHNLEIVTGPIARDGSGWAEVLKFLTTFYTAFEANCTNQTFKENERNYEYCAITVATLKAKMNATGTVATTKCYDDASKNLTQEKYETKVRFMIPEKKELRSDALSSGILNGFTANTQVNVAIDLGNLVNVDLKDLYGNENAIGYKAYARFCGTNLDGEKLLDLKRDATLTDDEKGFVLLYYVALNSFVDYFATKFPEMAPKPDELVHHILTGNDGKPIKISNQVEAAAFKNRFGLLPKTRLNDIYTSLLKDDPKLAEKAFETRPPDYYCDFDPKRKDACKAIHSKLWQVKLKPDEKTKVNQDPLDLEVVAASVFPLVPNAAKLRRVVLEMREETGKKAGKTLIGNRRIDAKKIDGQLVLRYKDTVKLPAGLP